MLSEDTEQFREVVARFLADKSPTQAVRKCMASAEGYEPDVWRQLCGEVGLAGTHLPERFGGFGFGPVELGITCQEMGRSLYCGPFFSSSVMAAHAILNQASNEQKERLLPGIADGSVIATLVLDNVADADRLGRSLFSDGARLDGTANMVVDAHIAQGFVVIASEGDGLAAFWVDAMQSGIDVEPLEALDPTRKLSRVSLSSVEGERLGDGPVDVTRLWDQLCTALAHEMIGGAEALFDSTIAYLKMRVQFGRPIGSFQALKHRAADLLMELELARAVTHEAARVLASGEGDPWTPNMAKAMAGDAYFAIAKQAIQLRGGIGFTWEEDVHLWFKRAKASEVLLGTPGWHREKMMMRMTKNSGGVDV